MRAAVLSVVVASGAALGDGLPPGWFVAGAPGDDAFVAAPAPSSCGQPRAVVLRSGEGVTAGWATVMQLLDATAWRGHRLRLSATLATRGVKGWAGLWMRVDAEEPRRPLAFDNMQQRPLTGSTPCATREVVLDVPTGAVTVAVGAVLEGAGELELSAVRLEVVSAAVATTDLVGRGGFKAGAPGLSPEETPNELADSLGRVGVAWFNERGVQSPELVLRQRHPARWSDASNDALVTLDGALLRVRLRELEGVFRFRREGDATLIDGEWGKQLKYPVSIRLTRGQLDMTWGFYERHLVREDSPRVDPGCARFVQYKGSNVSASDALTVCGLALGAAPPVQTTVAFLLTGFHRTRAGPAALPPPGVR